MWRSFTVASLCYNPQSTFYGHIRPQHTLRYITCTFHVTPLTEHTWLHLSYEGPGQCFLIQVSGLLTYTAAGGLRKSQSCPATASIFLRRAGHKCLCEILFPPHEARRMKCSEQPDLTDGKTALLSISMSDSWWVAISHSLLYPLIPYDGYNPPHV
jgi:hypothetical protein